jgi:hypothetical protein
MLVTLARSKRAGFINKTGHGGAASSRYFLQDFAAGKTFSPNDIQFAKKNLRFTQKVNV